jgi:hypothetical protein
VADKQSPLRRYLDARFPHTRPLQTVYKQQAGPLLVDGGPTHPGTIGAAFDYMVRFALDPDHDAPLAYQGFYNACAALRGRSETRTMDAVVRSAQDSARRLESGTASARVVATLARACWVLALATEFYRANIGSNSPLAGPLARRRLRPARLMELLPLDGLRQLAALHEIATTALYPHLTGSSETHLGPSFDGARWCPADADVISAGRLLDLKTNLGALDKNTGTRSDRLPLQHLYQLLGYVLFDRSDTYGLHTIGIYSARYGHLTWWTLDMALEALAGAPIDLQTEREHVWALLTGGTMPSHPVASAGPGYQSDTGRKAASGRPVDAHRSGRGIGPALGKEKVAPAKVRIMRTDKVTLLDDLDGTPASEAALLGLDGWHYETDF